MPGFYQIFELLITLTEGEEEREYDYHEDWQIVLLNSEQFDEAERNVADDIEHYAELHPVDVHVPEITVEKNNAEAWDN